MPDSDGHPDPEITGGAGGGGGGGDSLPKFFFRPSGLSLVSDKCLVLQTMHGFEFFPFFSTITHITE